jgi:hypothetical protein
MSEQSRRRPKFLFGALLATVVSSIVAFGPPAALFHYLKPETFGERLFMLLPVGFLFLVMLVVSFFLWVAIAAAFE